MQNVAHKLRLTRACGVPPPLFQMVAFLALGVR